VCLRFVFLLAVQIPAWLRLSRRPPTWKDAEILLLRHQLAVLQRQTAAQPKLRWTDRALSAALLTLIPRSCHGALHLFITPGTILRWQSDIVRRRWAAESKPKRPGRPPTHRRVVRLVLRMAADNEHWGYRRIAGELAGLGIAVAPSTVWVILKRHGIDPAPRRSGPGWAQFLRSQAEAILALDLFTVDLLDGTKAYVLAANRCSTASWWCKIKISAVFHASSRRDSRSPGASRVIRRKTNRRHMIGDHHGRTAGGTTLLVRAVDAILGTHRAKMIRVPGS
jgi:putative transposase